MFGFMPALGFFFNKIDIKVVLQKAYISEPLLLSHKLFPDALFPDV
jgi:hypothetical protein